MKPVRIASVSGLRGLIGNGLDPGVVVEFAGAFASGCAPGPILIGNDGRTTAGGLIPAVISAVVSTGHNAVLLGTVATPTIGRLVKTMGAAGGIQLTASHNPPEYNGLKCFQPAGMVLSPEQGRAVLDVMNRRAQRWVAWNQFGNVTEMVNPDAEHLRAILGVCDLEAIRARRFRVVLDSCHGAGGRLGRSLLEALGCQVEILGETADGLYEHTPEPLEENLRGLAEVVKQSGADVGFAQDPDADRLAIVDETGRYIGEELTLAIAARHRLSQASGPVVANLSTSSVSRAIAESRGQTFVRTPVGEYHVVAAMREQNALIGGEGNGGVIDPRIGLVRDSFAGMMLVLEAMASASDPLSSLVDGLPTFAMKKTKFPWDRPMAIAEFERVAAEFPDAQADFRDGLRLDWSDRWVQVRASNTEPILRVIAEGATSDDADALITAIARSIGIPRNGDITI